MMRPASALGTSARAAAACLVAVALAVPAAASAAWSGGLARWSVQPTPSPRGAGTLTILLGVSCFSATSCTAVGDHVTARRRNTVAERWNGTRWVLQPTPGADQTFASVACPAVRECLAVGGIDRALAERWNGTRWLEAGAVKPRLAPIAQLASVSCPAAAMCMAVGSYLLNNYQRPLAESWNGKTWSVLPIRGPTGFAVLSGVSCTGPASCTAVGTRETARAQLVYAERWNGRVWSAQPVPAPAGIPILTGVSCGGLAACTAVGLNVRPDSVHVLAEQWNGHAWTDHRVPAPARQGPGGGLFEAVSCGSPALCVAVGSYSSRGGVRRVMTELWNGSRWSVLNAPNPTARNSQLLGVSCLATGGCVAVGGFTEAHQTTATLAEHR